MYFNDVISLKITQQLLSINHSHIILQQSNFCTIYKFLIRMSYINVNLLYIIFMNSLGIMDFVDKTIVIITILGIEHKIPT